LGAIPVAAAAEECDDPAGMDADVFAGEADEILQSVVSVGVIDDDAETRAFRAGDDLEAAGDLLEFGSGVCDLVEGHTASERGTHRGEEVVDVHAAAQWRLNIGFSPRSKPAKRSFTHSCIHVSGLEVRTSLPGGLPSIGPLQRSA